MYFKSCSCVFGAPFEGAMFMYFCTVFYLEWCLCSLSKHLLNWRESMFSVLVMSGGLVLPQYLPTRPPSKQSIKAIKIFQHNQSICAQDLFKAIKVLKDNQIISCPYQCQGW